MKARGWLETIPDDDRRSQPFRLTAKGRELLSEAIPAWDRAQSAVKTLLGDDIVGQLNQAARRIAQHPTAG
jgi:DNA-binding MarR family transcriptional regulator